MAARARKPKTKPMTNMDVWASEALDLMGFTAHHMSKQYHDAYSKEPKAGPQTIANTGKRWQEMAALLAQHGYLESPTPKPPGFGPAIIGVPAWRPTAKTLALITRLEYEDWKEDRFEQLMDQVVRTT